MKKHKTKLFRMYQPVWGEAECANRAAHVAKDAMGKPFPHPGSLKGPYGAVPHSNGTIVGGEWYKGTYHPLPKLAEGYEIIYLPTWGYRLIKQEETDDHARN